MASHPGNTNAAKHGAYSRTGRVLQPRAEEIAAQLMDAPHTVPLDAVAAEEIGSLVALIEAIDADLAKRGPARKGLLDIRLRASGRLQRWLDGFSATPASRAAWAEQVARGRLADEIARRRQEAGT